MEGKTCRQIIVGQRWTTYSYPIVPRESVAKTRQIHKREDVRLSEVGRRSGLRRETPIVRVLTVSSVGLPEQTSRCSSRFRG
jgi:hypothetical protein